MTDPDESARAAREGGRLPTPDQPLNAQKRPVWKPLLYLVAFVAAVALVIFLGLALLVPAD